MVQKRSGRTEEKLQQPIVNIDVPGELMLSQFITHILKTPSTPTLPHMATACLQRMLICCQTKLLPYVHDSSPPAFASFVLQLEFNSEAAAVTGSNWGKEE